MMKTNLFQIFLYEEYEREDSKFYKKKIRKYETLKNVNEIVIQNNYYESNIYQ